jgi:hypothetical protein
MQRQDGRQYNIERDAGSIMKTKTERDHHRKWYCTVNGNL